MVKGNGTTRELENPKKDFENRLEGYYQMMINGILERPPDEFYEEAARWFAKLDDGMQLKFKKLKDGYPNETPFAYG